MGKKRLRHETLTFLRIEDYVISVLGVGGTAVRCEHWLILAQWLRITLCKDDPATDFNTSNLLMFCENIRVQ